MPVPVGYKHSEEAKRKIGQSKLGKKRASFSDEWRKNIGASHRGLKSPLKGRKISKKTREKIRATQKARYLSGKMYIPSAKGRKATEEQRRKLSEALRGEKAPGWRGGVYPENRRVRGSLEYRLWREAVFARDNYTCVWCGDSSGGNLNADHIKPFAFFPELRFDLANGRTLCVPCHETTETYKMRRIR